MRITKMHIATMSSGRVRCGRRAVPRRPPKRSSKNVCGCVGESRPAAPMSLSRVEHRPIRRSVPDPDDAVRAHRRGPRRCRESPTPQGAARRAATKGSSASISPGAASLAADAMPSGSRRLARLNRERGTTRAVSWSAEIRPRGRHIDQADLRYETGPGPRTLKDWRLAIGLEIEPRAGPASADLSNHGSVVRRWEEPQR